MTRYEIVSEHYDQEHRKPCAETTDLRAALDADVLVSVIREHAFLVTPGGDGYASLVCTCGVIFGGAATGWNNGAPVPPTYARHVATEYAALTPVVETTDLRAEITAGIHEWFCGGHGSQPRPAIGYPCERGAAVVFRHLALDAASPDTGSGR